MSSYDEERDELERAIRDPDSDPLLVAWGRIQLRKHAAGVPPAGEGAPELGNHAGILAGTDLTLDDPDAVLARVASTSADTLLEEVGGAPFGEIRSRLAGLYVDAILVGLELAKVRQERGQ